MPASVTNGGPGPGPKNGLKATVQGRLLDTQRQFFNALREPVFAESRARTELPTRVGQVSQSFVRTAQQLISPSASLRPVERLELYHRQYWYRLLESIGEDFPTLQQLLGDDAFWTLIEAYLLAQPATVNSLRHLGAGLADFISAGAMEPDQRCVAADMAHVEYALCMAFEKAERQRVEARQLATHTIDLQPHISLLALRSTADSLWRAFDNGRSIKKWPAPRNAAHRFVAVYRLGAELLVERLPRAAFMLLQAIARTGTLDLAMEQVLAAGLLRRKRERDQVAQWFGQWTAKG